MAKTATLTIRLDETDKREFQRIVERDKTTMTDFIVRAIRKASGRATKK